MIITTTLIVVAFILSFALSCGLGANDVSNAFATSIGAKVLSLRSAFIIASISEIIGSVLLGGLVTDKIIKASITPGILMPGETILVMIASLVSVTFWLALATWLKLPVSATHAVIAAMIGGGIMANSEAVCWAQISPMVIAWVLAPVLSGLFSSIVYTLIERRILWRSNPIEAGLSAIPFIYALTIGVNASMIGYQLIVKLALSLTMIIVALAIIAVIILGTLLVSYLFLVPWIKKSIELSSEKTKDRKSDSEETMSSDLSENIEYRTFPKLILEKEFLKASPENVSSKTPSDDIELQALKPSSEDAERIFNILQILSAIFTSFAHGSNDVSNSIGPLLGLLNAYRMTLGMPPLTPNSPALYGLLAFGGVGMIVGLFTWGARVIETLGLRLTSASISPSKGFAIELGAAFTVLGASLIGISVSTTHCKVGAIVAIGISSSHPKQVDMKKGQPVNWRLIGDIFASWICTMPTSGLLSAGVYCILSNFLVTL